MNYLLTKLTTSLWHKWNKNRVLILKTFIQSFIYVKYYSNDQKY